MPKLPIEEPKNNGPLRMKDLKVIEWFDDLEVKKVAASVLSAVISIGAIVIYIDNRYAKELEMKVKIEQVKNDLLLEENRFNLMLQLAQRRSTVAEEPIVLRGPAADPVTATNIYATREASIEEKKQIESQRSEADILNLLKLEAAKKAEKINSGN